MKPEFKIGDKVVTIGQAEFGTFGFAAGMKGTVRDVFMDCCLVEMGEGWQLLYRKENIELESLIWADDEITDQP
jgi:hypothetical protein